MLQVDLIIWWHLYFGGDEGTIEEATKQFVGYIEAFIENIGTQVPKMLDVASNLISTLINTISDNLPQIVDAGLKIVTQLLGRHNE